MQQLQQNYEPGKELDITTNLLSVPEDNRVIEHDSVCNEQCENSGCLSGECKLNTSWYNIIEIYKKKKKIFLIGSVQTLFPASMWTRKDIDEFKANLVRDGGESVIKVNHGETITVSILQKYVYKRYDIAQW